MATKIRERRKMLRIPNQVVLPFGYRISVRQLSDAEMDKRDSNADGIWDDDTKTIYERKRLPVNWATPGWIGNIGIWTTERPASNVVND